MGLPLVVDSIVRTVLMLNYLVYVDHVLPFVDEPTSGKLRGNKDFSRNCNDIRAINDHLYDMATANCEALWARYDSATKEALAILHKDDWKVEVKEHDLVIKKSYLPDYKRSAILGETILSVSPEEALYLFWDVGVEIPRWNPEILYIEDFVTIGSHLRLSYQVSKSQLAGLVSPRDFLVLVGHFQSDNTIYITYTNVTDEYKPHPIKSHYVRGVNGASLFAFERIPREPLKTKFKYLLNYDMRLSRFILQSMVDRATAAALKDYLKYVRARAEVTALSRERSPSRFFPDGT